MSNVTTTQKEEVDVVIPWVNDKEDWQSLRYVIRSVEKNFIDMRNLWIVGDKPDFLDPNTYNYIPNPSKDSNDLLIRNRHFCNSMYLAAICPEVSPTFLYMADNHYLATPRTAKDFRTTILVRENMAEYSQIERKTANTSWQLMIWDTVDRLLDHGLSGWNYETHTPKLINKDKLLDCLVFFGIGDGKLIWQTAYFNMFLTPTTRGHLSESTKLKAGFYEKCTADEIAAKCMDAIYINHNDLGLSDELKAYLEAYFSTPSKYENTEPSE